MKAVVDDILGLEVQGYRIVRKVGSGGMGAVYEAVHPIIGQRVAIKVLFPEFSQSEDDVRRFIDEARAASKVEHSGLVRIYNHGRLTTDAAFIMMEFLSGESLRKYLERVAAESRLLPQSEALSIAHEIADTLVAVHRLDIVHRDIKPENLMLCAPERPSRFNRVKIVDFGIAKFNNMNSSGGVNSTTIGRFLGTALYASPEQCQMSGAVSTKADVYSLGVVLYEMLAGRPPFFADQPGMIIGMHLFQQPPPLERFVSGIPESIETLVTEMLVKDPLQRLSMEQVLQRIIAIETGTLPRRMSKKGRRRLSIVVLIFATLMLSGIYYYQHIKSTNSNSLTAGIRTEASQQPQRHPLPEEKILSPSTASPIAPLSRAPAETPKAQTTSSTKVPPSDSRKKHSAEIAVPRRLSSIAKSAVESRTMKDDPVQPVNEKKALDKTSLTPSTKTEGKDPVPVATPPATKIRRADHEDAFY